MKKIFCSKLIIVLAIIFVLCFGITINRYVIATSNSIYVTGPSSVQEGESITFSVKFGKNINRIWLSDGDIIKIGFSGVVKVNKVSDNNYNVVISNVSGVGDNRYIVINSGVGDINYVPTSAVNSNVFSITKKPVKVEQPTNDDIKDDTNNNNNNDNNNKPSDNTNNNIANKPAVNNKNNVNNNINNNINNNVNNNVKNEIQDDKIEEEKEEKVLREIPNTGKVF